MSEPLVNQWIWDLLSRYWVLPMPENYAPTFGYLELDGFCVVCGDWMSKTDPEVSACPQRYAIPHAEILPFVFEELRRIESADEPLHVAAMKEAAKKARTKWHVNCHSDV